MSASCNAHGRVEDAALDFGDDALVGADLAGQLGLGELAALAGGSEDVGVDHEHSFMLPNPRPGHEAQ